MAKRLRDGLTPKQKKFADELLLNPKKPALRVAMDTYGREDKPITYRSANAIAGENLQKPAIMAYMAKHSEKAERRIIEAMDAEKKIYKLNHETKTWDYLGSEQDHAIRLKASQDILDRLHGKATQRVEQQSTSVTFTIDLSGKAHTDQA